MPYYLFTDYLSIILYGGIFQALGFGLNHMIRAQGSPKIAIVLC